MIKEREIKHLRVFAGAAHQVVVLHAMTVVRDGDDSGLFQAADGCEFFAGDALGDRTADENIDDAFPFGDFADEGDSAGRINRGRRVGHADDGGESAARRRRRAGGDVFLGRLARFAEMDVQINQAGTDDNIRIAVVQSSNADPTPASNEFVMYGSLVKASGDVGFADRGMAGPYELNSANNDQLVVYSTNGNISFVCTGDEGVA